MTAKPLTSFTPAYPLTVPAHLAGRTLWGSDESRRLGIHIMGRPGAAKSRLAGRILGYVDFRRGSRQVILDGVGGTIDNFLHRMICLPPSLQEQLWPRIRYTDLYAHDFIDPKHLFYRLRPDEPLATTAGRYLEVIHAADPFLQKAGVEGWNPLVALGTATGMLASALNLQVTAAVDFLHNPEQWLPRLTNALSSHPELPMALNELRSFAKLSVEARRRRAGSLLTKLQPTLLNPIFTALLASPRRGITMEQVDDGCLTWLIDGRHLPAANRQEILLWMLRLVIDYLRHRHMAGRERPIGLVIDEPTQFFGFSMEQNDAIAALFEELTSVISRNYGCNLTVLHQSLVQIQSERIRAALMAMGTQIVGQLSSADDRLYVARHFMKYAPLRSKQLIPTYFNMAEPEMLWGGLHPQIFSRPNPIILDYINEPYSVDEQVQLLADRFAALDRFCFLVGSATAEGSVSTTLEEITIEPFDQGRYPDEEILADTRRQLRERDGYPVAQLLAEIEQAQQEVLSISTPAGSHKLPSESDKPSPATARNRRRRGRRRDKNQDAILEKGDARDNRTKHPLPAAEEATSTSDAWQEGLWQQP